MIYAESQSKNTNYVSVNSFIQTKKYKDTGIFSSSASTAEDKIGKENLAHRAPTQTPANNRGLPDNLKTGLENHSDFSMDDVWVHYNSFKPAQFNALAYTQGTDIYVAPGQEKYLPHEAWHVAQQKQGRVQPISQIKGTGIGVNDDPALEREADEMARRTTDHPEGLKEHIILGADKRESEAEVHKTKHGTALQPKTNLGGSHNHHNDQGVIQGVFTDGRILYRLAWLRDIIEAWGGAARFIEYEILLEVGEDGWKNFIKKLNAKTQYKLDDVAQRIIKIMNRARRDLRGPNLQRDFFELPQQKEFTLSVSTHNIEKFGLGTKNKDQKAKLDMELIRRLAPDLAGMQEVTRQDLLKESFRAEPDFGEEFAMLYGPSYQSGTYQESYPAVFNRGTVHFIPGLFYFDPGKPEDTQIQPYSQALSFGKQAAEETGQPQSKQARPTSYWEFFLPATRNLRPAYKFMDSAGDAMDYAVRHKNLRHRRIAPYFLIRHLNVHTSPGKSTPTINAQVADIMKNMGRLGVDEPNTLAGGDFYMQKGAKGFWRRLTGKDASPYCVVAPGVPTNFKRGRGVQIADHFVMPSGWKGRVARAYPPRTGAELSDWEKYQIDHAFVSGSAMVPIGATVSALSIYLQSFFKEAIYRQNNCLIHAIGKASDTNHLLTDARIHQIREELYSRQGVAIGDFIEANDENIKIIMRNLDLYGIVYIDNVDRPELAAAPVHVKMEDGGSNQAEIRIYYSCYHFYAAPKN